MADLAIRAPVSSCTSHTGQTAEEYAEGDLQYQAFLALDGGWARGEVVQFVAVGTQVQVVVSHRLLKGRDCLAVSLGVAD